MVNRQSSGQPCRSRTCPRYVGILRDPMVEHPNPTKNKQLCLRNHADYGGYLQMNMAVSLGGTVLLEQYGAFHEFRLPICDDR